MVKQTASSGSAAAAIIALSTLACFGDLSCRLQSNRLRIDVAVPVLVVDCSDDDDTAMVVTLPLVGIQSGRMTVLLFVQRP